MYRNALLAVDIQEEIFRIFYYDCPPYDRQEKNPIDGSAQDFKGSKKYAARSRFLTEFKSLDFVAMRLGVVKARGWTLCETYIKRSISGKHMPPAANDVFFSMEQKGVDMRIGIDVLKPHDFPGDKTSRPHAARPWERSGIGRTGGTL
jgi:uncharacterized LabA/DUF88 family protein